MRYRVNAPQVIHETIDDETIVINLDSGTYYSLRGTGAEIWSMLFSSLSADEVVSELLRRHEGDADKVRAAVGDLVDELCADRLLLPDDEADPAPPIAVFDGVRSAFEPPQFERFSDMEHLIAIDPIHEVDPAKGWPQT
jgi:Coenzyme PQQ synthesis protein D (PqqD)